MVVLHSKTNVLFLNGLSAMFISKFEHISYSTSAKLQKAKVFNTSDIACILLFSPPSGGRMKSVYCDTETGHIILLVKIIPL